MNKKAIALILSAFLLVTGCNSSPSDSEVISSAETTPPFRSADFADGVFTIYDENQTALFTIENVDSMPMFTHDRKFILYTTECKGEILPEMQHDNYGFNSSLHDLFVLNENGEIVFTQPYTYLACTGNGIVVYMCYNPDYNPDAPHSETGGTPPVRTMLLALNTMETRDITDIAYVDVNNIGFLKSNKNWLIGQGTSLSGDEACIYFANLVTGERKSMAANLFTTYYYVADFFPDDFGIAYVIYTKRGAVFLDENYNDFFTGFKFPESYLPYMNNGGEPAGEFDCLPKYFPFAEIKVANDENISVLRTDTNEWETVSIYELADM